MQRAIAIATGAATIALLLLFVGRDYPFVGFDFGEYLPRFVDTDLHIRINGMAPQWYTPSFGAGLPAFANPQHYQYSLIQLLFLIVGPWDAVMISTALACAAGFAAFYLFLTETLMLSAVAGALGAMSLIANGFYIQHIAGGALGFQLFPMMGVFLYVATARRLSMAVASVIIGMTAAAIVHAGGALIAVLMAGSLILSLQVLHLLAPAAFDLRRTLTAGVAGAAIALALSASKLYAVNAFMTHFPRELSDTYPISLPLALFGLGSQIAGAMMIVPILFAGGYPTQRLDDALVRVTGSGVHVAELDVSLQPVLSITLAIAAVCVLAKLIRGELSISKPRAIELLLLAAATWIAVETTLARGFIYPVLHELPFFRSMHVNHRVAGVFVVPMTIAAAFAIDRWRAHRRPAVAAALLAAAIGFQCTYFLLPDQFYRRWFDITEIERTHALVRQAERFPITRVDSVPEDLLIGRGATGRVPYEPLFGYDNEHFRTEAVEGPVTMVRDGKFNMTNPASLIFPELNGLRLFERIDAGDRGNLERFVQRRQPQWKHPRILDWLNDLALVTLAGCVLVMIRAAFRALAFSSD